jgi:hypothetical protein
MEGGESIMNKMTILKMVLGAAGAVLTIASQAVGEKKDKNAETKEN